MARQNGHTDPSAALSLPCRTRSILAEQTESKPLAKVLAQTRNDVEQGGSLSEFVEPAQDRFPPLMINMIQAGRSVASSSRR